MRQRVQAASAAALLLAALLLLGVAASDAIRVRSFSAERSQGAAAGADTYLGPDAATSHRKLQQLPKPASAQIFLNGILQDAKLDAACAAKPGPATCGGTLVVNNVPVVVPSNLMVFFPANALTWQECFNGGKTGLAFNDPPAVPGATYIVTVTANRVAGEVRAALISIAQDTANLGSGFIDSIDYATGELTIEGGAKVRINDPTGRYGRIQAGPAFDDRFCVDPDNPTIRSSTGFPMCIPRTDPAAAAGDDVDCPTSTGRPLSAAGVPQTIIEMNIPGKIPDPTKMVPFMVGDYITFAGVLTADGFFAAYEIVNNVAIYTRAGFDPAYTVFEVAISGTGGLNIPGIGEAAIREKYEGFTTDPSRPIQIWALDFNFADGTFSKRDLGQVMPDPGPPAGGVRGRWRFAAPCRNAGAVLGVGSPFLGTKGCTAPAAGVYTPPSREVMSEIVKCKPFAGAANNITSGDAPARHAGCMYRSPAIEYVWPENVPGSPIVENNFQAVPFLTRGGYTSAKGTLVGALDPWPGATLPADSCAPPVITVDTGLTVASGGTVTLNAAVTGTSTPFKYLWAADSPTASGVFSAATQPLTTFSPVVADAAGGTTAAFTLTVTNACGAAAKAKAIVTVADAGPAAKEIIQVIPPMTVNSGTGFNITASLSGGGTSAFTWAVPAALTIKKQVPAAAVATSSSVLFLNAPIIPVGTLTPSKYVVSVTAGASAPVAATITVTPPSDTITITSVLLRCDKHRLTMTATSSIVDPALKLSLAPYTDNNGTAFNPAPLGNSFTNLGGGQYTMTLQPVPLPSMTVSSLQVTSNAGGKSLLIKISLPQIKGTCKI